MVLCFHAKNRPFTFAELQAVTSLGRGEIRECVNRGIISAPAGVGQGNHRSYSKWNLVEGVIAAALLQHVRAGSVAAAMWRLHLLLKSRGIDRKAIASHGERRIPSITRWISSHAENQTIRQIRPGAKKRV